MPAGNESKSKGKGTLLVHPKSMKDRQVQAAVEQAIRDLRYGTVTINCWSAMGYGLVITSWGAYPGHDVYDIQSGSGVVHNTLMFDRIEKSGFSFPGGMSESRYGHSHD